MNKKHLEYWETLCPYADTEIDNYIRLLFFFNKLWANYEKDFFDYCGLFYQ